MYSEADQIVKGCLQSKDLYIIVEDETTVEDDKPNIADGCWMAADDEPGHLPFDAVGQDVGCAG